MKISVDLRARFGPARDQGRRPTCLAFAASDTHAALRGQWDALSCEYAFYQAQKQSGRPPDKGALLDDMLAALRDEGQPRENGWPYLAQLPADLGEYAPPKAVGTLFGRDGVQRALNVATVYRALADDVPAIVLSKLTRLFFTPPPDGVIDLIDADEVFPAPRHAVVAVGYGEASQGRVVLIRNSWGSSWGLDGYGWLTEQFLARHMYGLAVLTDETDVSHRSAAA